jgi:hypothetical protein
MDVTIVRDQFPVASSMAYFSTAAAALGKARLTALDPSGVRRRICARASALSAPCHIDWLKCGRKQKTIARSTISWWSIRGTPG